jgi:serine O-acetyltransferase
MIKDIECYRAMHARHGTDRRNTKSLYMCPFAPLFPLAVHRFGTWVNKKWGKHLNKNLVRFVFKSFYHLGRFLSVVIWKTEIDEDSVIDEGVYFSPKGGIILGADAIGRGCTIHQNVTIGFGFGSGRKMQRPIIGRNVWIGPGAVIYGKITIGEGSIIYPNSIINKSFPPHCIVSGNPAKIIKRNITDDDLLKSTSEIQAFGNLPFSKRE